MPRPRMATQGNVPVVLPANKRKTRQSSENKQNNKFEKSPILEAKKRRAALGNLTNNVVKSNVEDYLGKKIEKAKVISIVPQNKSNDVRRSLRIKVIKDQQPAKEVQHATRSSVTALNKINASKAAAKSSDAKNVATKPIVKKVSATIKETIESPDVFFDATEEEVETSSSFVTPGSTEKSLSVERSKSLFYSLHSSKHEEDVRVLPEGVTDFDKELEKDVFSASAYAMDIFSYFKEREKKFVVEPYLDLHPELNVHMRGILVDWMIEVQENFELNHESLYMSVKLMDFYLSKSKVPVSKDMYQLLGVTCLFVSTKFEERSPPLIEDFLYICEDAYTRDELLDMEEDVLKTVDFDIGFPLSYSFLRRYSRTAKHTMAVLTLARFFLESTLLDYRYVSKSESKLAAATLCLAVKMTQNMSWSPTLVYYSGYEEEELRELVLDLAENIPRYPREGLKNIFNKYSHEAFFQVAKQDIPFSDELVFNQ